MLSPSFNLDDLLAKYMEMLQEDVYDNSTSTSYDGDTSDYTDTEGSVSSFNDVEYVQPNNVNPISSSTPGWVEETSMNPDDYRPVPRCDAPIRAQVIGLGLGMEHSNSIGEEEAMFLLQSVHPMSVARFSPLLPVPKLTSPHVSFAVPTSNVLRSLSERGSRAQNRDVNPEKTSPSATGLRRSGGAILFSSPPLLALVHDSVPRRLFSTMNQAASVVNKSLVSLVTAGPHAAPMEVEEARLPPAMQSSPIPPVNIPRITAWASACYPGSPCLGPLALDSDNDNGCDDWFSPMMSHYGGQDDEVDEEAYFPRVLRDDHEMTDPFAPQAHDMFSPRNIEDSPVFPRSVGQVLFGL